MTTLYDVLKKHRNEFSNVLPHDIQHGNAYIMDLSIDHSEFADIDPTDIDQLIARTQQLLNAHHAVLGISRYAENRMIYQDRELFSGDGKNTRTFHIGIDLSAPVGTPIFAPLDACIHSFKNNTENGSYGPTVILEHELDGTTFYTLYGHLTRESLNNLKDEKQIGKGEIFGAIGNSSVNGGWPPHLHFQIIDDMENYYGDFPGSVELNEKAHYLQRCPDPNLILNIAALSP